ncbi:MAG: hypothetical protein JWM33_166, partial [Caulobacteraceae bacterium]|nr:hypothetical protein [Caulobacteraceae bacterium]
MSQSLLPILVASLPLAALAWSLGWLAEQTRIGPRARAAIWQLAVLAPLLLAPAVWTAASLDWTRPAPAPITMSAQVAATAPALDATMATTNRPPLAAPAPAPTLPVL